MRARPEPPRAQPRGAAGVEQVRALERAAAQQPRAAGAALVEDDQVAVAEGRREHAEAVALERLVADCPGPPASTNRAPAARPLLRPDALDEQRHVPGRGPAAVERHAHAGAAEQERAAGPEAHGRAAARRAAGSRGEQGDGDAHSPIMGSGGRAQGRRRQLSRSGGTGPTAVPPGVEFLADSEKLDKAPAGTERCAEFEPPWLHEPPHPRSLPLDCCFFGLGDARALSACAGAAPGGGPRQQLAAGHGRTRGSGGA